MNNNFEEIQMDGCKDFSKELSNDSDIFDFHNQPHKHVEKESHKINECDLNRQSSEAIDLNELSDKDHSNLIEDSPKLSSQHFKLFTQKPRLSKTDKAHYSEGEINIADNLFYPNDNIFERPKIDLKQLMGFDYSSKQCMFCLGSSKDGNQKEVKKQNNQTVTKKNHSFVSEMDSAEILKLYRDVTNDEIKTSFRSCKEVINYNLELKYLTSREYYNTKIINDVIYNENTHIVSVFKDYLIYDDVSEFLKRHYDQNESKKRLPKVIEFYETYSKVFPNYVNLPENKFMFKNIERKQLYWDSKQHFLMEQEERNAKKRARIEDFGGVQNAPSSFFDETIEDKMFSGSFINSVDMMETLKNNQESFLKIVNIKNEQDSYVHQDNSNSKSQKKSIAKQFEFIIKKYADKDNSSVFSKSEVDFSELSRLNQNESFCKANEKETEVSDFFKMSTRRMKENEQQK